ncbi:hypothetical protein [Serratia fonticola]|uniref:hypothetical protein n=1 Tax=Serratia fonticola TaxID=47917 RepID=UPI0027EE92F5|nr:hypothetical protein [Serratia fonticola]MDQ7208126.1 hypothetical protein [Serratia fonticola]HBE9079935.1 hypothetical protein [Serratia fonticola]HBE9090685.1 hypothetical protein [Serratia fonticola]HBE9153447.1 hypothetical protein [Serratia fonticola]
MALLELLYRLYMWLNEVQEEQKASIDGKPGQLMWLWKNIAIATCDRDLRSLKKKNPT